MFTGRNWFFQRLRILFWRSTQLVVEATVLRDLENGVGLSEGVRGGEGIVIICFDATVYCSA